jgi:hypothetical protein
MRAGLASVRMAIFSSPGFGGGYHPVVRGDMRAGERM